METTKTRYLRIRPSVFLKVQLETHRIQFTGSQMHYEACRIVCLNLQSHVNLEMSLLQHRGPRIRVRPRPHAIPSTMKKAPTQQVMQRVNREVSPKQPTGNRLRIPQPTLIGGNPSENVQHAGSSCNLTFE
ncbi:hypothetical protein KC19_VG245800 [Ceratodon purpureus]|uniref:Uncharacterized protein n=1 Tax=Ceratodon purpureus TaxID=3225 RepID=A0A8T0HU10_CERPU|nr:hypothetical protein KC19_VG245800 [Ceratodon purpureus]